MVFSYFCSYFSNMSGTAPKKSSQATWIRKEKTNHGH